MPDRPQVPSASSDLSRRDVARLFGAGALTLALGSSWSFAEDAPNPGRKPATAPGTADQGAGFYRFKIGGLDATIVNDGTIVGQPATLFPKAPKDEFEAIARANFFSLGYFPIGVNALVLRDGASTILVDTGVGNAMGPSAGKLIGNLARAGVRRADVTHVVLTHAHGDHIGGLLDAGGKPNFPNARVVMGATEHAFWTGADPAATFKSAGTLLPPDAYGGMIAAAQTTLKAVADRIELKQGGDRIGTSIQVVDAFGHTPGHVMLDISNGDSTFRYVADLLHVLPVQLAHPDWALLFDTDPSAAAATRKTFIGEIVAARTPIAGAHLPFPTLGNLAADGANVRWIPKIWEW